MQKPAIRMAKMQELSKMFLRRFKNIEYRNIDLISGYEKTEMEYKTMRNSVSMIGAMLKTLGNYEHGNKMYKDIKNGLQFLNDKASLGLFKSMDIYEDAAVIGDSVRRLEGNSELSSIGKKYAEVFRLISKSKRCLNTRLECIHVKLRDPKARIQEIDRQRKHVRNMRFDMEMLMQDDGYNGEIKDTEKAEYEDASKSAMDAMREFVSDEALADIIKDVGREYRVHMEECADALKFFE